MVVPKTPQRFETSSSFQDRTLVIDYDDGDEQQRAPHDGEDENMMSLKEEEEEEFSMTKGTSLLSKVQTIMEREPTPVVRTTQLSK